MVDPVSFMDGSANNNIKWNPFTSGSLWHAYDNIADKFQADKSAPPPNFSMDELDDTKMTAMTE